MAKYYLSAFADEAGKDIAGGQRIYNGALDIGPGEYDWRRIFTERLNRRGVSVDAASAGVTSAEIEGLSLKEEDTLNLALVFKNGGTLKACLGKHGVNLFAQATLGKRNVYHKVASFLKSTSSRYLSFCGIAFCTLTLLPLSA